MITHTKTFSYYTPTWKIEEKLIIHSKINSKIFEKKQKYKKRSYNSSGVLLQLQSVDISAVLCFWKKKHQRRTCKPVVIELCTRLSFRGFFSYVAGDVVNEWRHSATRARTLSRRSNELSAVSTTDFCWSSDISGRDISTLHMADTPLPILLNSSS